MNSIELLNGQFELIKNRIEENYKNCNDEEARNFLELLNKMLPEEHRVNLKELSS